MYVLTQRNYTVVLRESKGKELYFKTIKNISMCIKVQSSLDQGNESTPVWTPYPWVTISGSKRKKSKRERICLGNLRVKRFNFEGVVVKQ